MQVNSEENMVKEVSLNDSDKRYFRCSGRISNKKSWLYGKPCNKILAEPNAQGLINGKIKCPHCGHINEI